MTRDYTKTDANLVIGSTITGLGIGFLGAAYGLPMALMEENLLNFSAFADYLTNTDFPNSLAPLLMAGAFGGSAGTLIGSSVGHGLMHTKRCFEDKKGGLEDKIGN